MPRALSSGQPMAWPSARLQEIKASQKLLQMARADCHMLGRPPKRHLLRHLRPASARNGFGLVDGKRNSFVPCHYDQTNPAISPDGGGGSIITWQDFETAITIYSHSGCRWGQCHLDRRRPGHLHSHEPSSYAVNNDRRRGRGHNFLVRLSHRQSRHLRPADESGGRALWTANGLAVCAERTLKVPHHHRRRRWGAMLAWYDDRNGGTYDLYSQRVDSTVRFSGLPMAWQYAKPRITNTRRP